MARQRLRGVSDNRLQISTISHYHRFAAGSAPQKLATAMGTPAQQHLHSTTDVGWSLLTQFFLRLFHFLSDNPPPKPETKYYERIRCYITEKFPYVLPLVLRPMSVISAASRAHRERLQVGKKLHLSIIREGEPTCVTICG